MSDFADGKTDVLVSTTVIEVGVNVPNACLMIVENADRFGLSQLHQLRGRVGRGKRKSYCVLVSDAAGKEGSVASMRLKSLCTLYDGYAIAERDLQMRGPGDFFASGASIRQSGDTGLGISKSCQDTDLVHSAFEAAHDLLEFDPDLTMDCHRQIKEELAKSLNEKTSTIN